MITPKDIFHIEVTTADIELLGKLLRAQPYAEVVSIISRIEAQLRAQQGVTDVRETTVNKEV